MDYNFTLYSYIVKTDFGFAPNPFWDYCTLACCKPRIRVNAKKGDWIVGLSKKQYGNKLIYAMKITEKPLNFAEYYNDHRFKSKRPNMKHKKRLFHRGDNIYQPIGNKILQLHSRHSNRDGTENQDKKKKDLSGKYVLVSNRFYYFGNKMIVLPIELGFLIVGRGHKCRFSEEQKGSFLKFIKKQKRGLYGHPSFGWDKKDVFWKRVCS